MPASLFVCLGSRHVIPSSFLFVLLDERQTDIRFRGPSTSKSGVGEFARKDPGGTSDMAGYLRR
jgi:hypothetical protein